MPDVLTVPNPAIETPPTYAPRPSADPAERGARKPAPARPAGLPRSTMILAAVAVALFLWAAWMTKAVIDLRAGDAPFVSVRLQPLVEEYVQAQARTSTPEEQVTRETRAFMDALDAELRARGESGSTIMVAEAVLSKNVPDVTDDIRRSVYAKVPAPGGLPSGPVGAGGSTGGLGR